MTDIDCCAPALGPEASTFLAVATHKILIGGQWSESCSGHTLDTLDPATGKVIGTIQRCNAGDVDAAVAAARSAFASWSGITPMARSQLLWRIANIFEAHIDELAELETLDQGKALYVGRWAEIPGAVAQFRYFAGMATKIEGATIPTSINYQPPGKEIFAYTQKVPVGVVGAIVPWNSPLVLTAMKIAPALAAGCTIVLKPSEETSLTAIRMLQLMQEAGLPDGVINLVTGYGVEAGAALAAHMDVDKITFTGSTATGRAILDASKGNLKRVTLELGGKSPVIIMPDADLSAAIPGAANAIFFNGGQVCIAGSRLYAHRSVYDRVLDGVTQAAEAIALGHGLNPVTQMGPLISKAHAAKVADYIANSKQDGASIICGGETAGPNDSFVFPTVIADAKPGLRIVQEEVFGPVVVVAPFDDMDEVIDAANDSPYGLAAGIWSESLSNATRLASRIRAGTIWINSHAMYDASLPIGLRGDLIVRQSRRQQRNGRSLGRTAA